MKLDNAKLIADVIVNFLNPLCNRIEIAGSIRREKPEVKDIDIVVEMQSNCSPVSIQNKMEECGSRTLRSGDKFLQFDYKGTQVDIYVADKSNYEVILLIRTGSAEHNRMLCSKALEKGLKMTFNLGLINKDMNVIANTEKDILETLLGKYINPEDRN